MIMKVDDVKKRIHLIGRLKIVGLSFLISLILCGCGFNKINQRDIQKQETTDLEEENHNFNDLEHSVVKYGWQWVFKLKEYEYCYMTNTDDLVIKDKNGKYGLVDLPTKKLIIPCEQEEIGKYSEGMIAIMQNGKYYYADTSGNVCIQEDFEDASVFSEGYAAVKKRDRWGYINRNGKYVIKPQYNQAKEFSEGLAAVEINGEWGVIDTAGNIRVKPQFDCIRSYKDGRAIVSLKGRYGIIDREGNLIIDCIYDEIKGMKEGYITVCNEGKWGLLDANGNQMIPIENDYMGVFSEGKVAIIRYNDEKQMKQWAYLNEHGDVVISYNYFCSPAWIDDVATDFNNGTAFISDMIYMIIDAQGNFLFDGNSDFFISYLDYNCILDVIPGYLYIDNTMKIKKYGLMGIHGEEKLEPVFDWIQPCGGKYFLVEYEENGENLKGIIELIRK